MRTGDEGKARQKLGNVHDDAPSQVSAHVGAVAHCSGEAEGRANDQRPCWDVRHVPVGRRVHQADSEQPGGLGMEIRAWSTHCGPPDVGGDAGRGLYSRFFSVQKRRQRRPQCVLDILCRLKKEGYSWHVAFPT